MLSFNRRRFFDAAGLVAATSVLDAIRPTRTAQAAAGSLAWNVKGGKVYACPCDFGSAPSHGSCTVIQGFRIDSGRYGNVMLDGLNAALMVHSPGHMADGHFRIAFYLDDRADPAQRDALSTIFTIKPGGAFARISKATDQDLGARLCRSRLRVVRGNGSLRSAVSPRPMLRRSRGGTGVSPL